MEKSEYISLNIELIKLFVWQENGDVIELV